MRFSLASVALLAGAAAAAPQVQPISQISDGQIQAPPATSAVPLPSVVPSSGSSVVVVPTPSKSATPVVPGSGSVVVPSATATPIAPGVPGTVPVVTAPSGGNATVPAPTGGVSSGPSASGSSPAGSASSAAGSTGASGSRTSSTGVPQASAGAAAGNFVSFGGLVLAIGAAVLA